MFNPEQWSSNPASKGTKEGGIIEKEPMVLENFEIYCDKETEEVFEPGDEKKFDEIKGLVEGMLGSKWRLADKINTYLFSDEKEYYNFLDRNFPGSPKDAATFDKKTNSIANFTPIYKIEKLDKDLLEKEGIFEEQIRDIYQANMLSGVGHEFSHLHPFYGGVGNKDTKSKWEQEMTCIFIGEKIRTKFGNERFRNHQLKQAQEELKQLQKQNKDFLWQEVGKNWNEITNLERFVYPWLEKKYGIKKLQNLWEQLFKEKKPLAEAIGDIYKTNIEDLEKDFEKDISAAKNCKEIEK